MIYTIQVKQFLFYDHFYTTTFATILIWLIMSGCLPLSHLCVTFSPPLIVDHIRIVAFVQRLSQAQMLMGINLLFLAILHSHFSKHLTSDYLFYFILIIKILIFLNFFNCVSFITYNNHRLLSSFNLEICKEGKKKLNAK